MSFTGFRHMTTPIAGLDLGLDDLESNGDTKHKSGGSTVLRTTILSVSPSSTGPLLLLSDIELVRLIKMEVLGDSNKKYYGPLSDFYLFRDETNNSVYIFFGNANYLNKNFTVVFDYKATA